MRKIFIFSSSGAYNKVNKEKNHHRNFPFSICTVANNILYLYSNNVELIRHTTKSCAHVLFYVKSVKTYTMCRCQQMHTCEYFIISQKTRKPTKRKTLIYI